MMEKQKCIPIGCVLPTLYHTGSLCLGGEGGLCPGGVSVQGRSCPGGLYPGGLSPGGLCPGGLCLNESLSRGLCGGSLCRGLCPWGSLFRVVSVRRVSVQGGLYQAVSVQGGLCRRVSARGSLSRGISVRGFSVQGISVDRDPLPPVNRITDRCKNITFPQLRLRAVMIDSVNFNYLQTERPFRKKVNALFSEQYARTTVLTMIYG